MSALCAAARVRRVHAALSDEVVTDDAILAVAADITSEVNGALDGYGAPWTDTTDAPDIVQQVAATLTAAVVFDSYFYQTSQESGVAAALRKRAYEIIEKIRAGEVRGTGITSVSSAAFTTIDDDRPSTEIFVGDETTWTDRAESREA